MKVLDEHFPLKDGRAIDPKSMESIRLLAVAAVQRGHSPEAVIKILGFSRSCIYAWLDSYKTGGWDALRARPVAGRPPELDPAGKAWLKQTVLAGTPEKWGYDTALWTRGILAQLVDQRFGVKVSEPTVGRYLHELALSPQVPNWKAHEQDPEAVRRFVEEKYPRIVRLANKIRAQIYFLDESGCRATEHRGRTWGLMGQRPELQSTGQRFGLNLISAISPEGQLRFKVFEHSIRSAEVIEFLTALLQGSDQPLIVVMDNHSMHFSAAIKAFARPQRPRLKLFSLPTYSPECNPDEGVWSEVKPHGVSRQRIHDKQDFKKKVRHALHRLQKQTAKIFSFFVRTPECATMCQTELAMSGFL
jgi:transposase